MKSGNLKTEKMEKKFKAVKDIVNILTSFKHPSALIILKMAEDTLNEEFYRDPSKIKICLMKNF